MAGSNSLMKAIEGVGGGGNRKLIEFTILHSPRHQNGEELTDTPRSFSGTTCAKKSAIMRGATPLGRIAGGMKLIDFRLERNHDTVGGCNHFVVPWVGFAGRICNSLGCASVCRRLRDEDDHMS